MRVCSKLEKAFEAESEKVIAGTDQTVVRALFVSPILPDHKFYRLRNDVSLAIGLFMPVGSLLAQVSGKLPSETSVTRISSSLEVPASVSRARMKFRRSPGLWINDASSLFAHNLGFKKHEWCVG